MPRRHPVFVLTGPRKMNLGCIIKRIQKNNEIRETFPEIKMKIIEVRSYYRQGVDCSNRQYHPNEDGAGGVYLNEMILNIQALQAKKRSRGKIIIVVGDKQKIGFDAVDAIAFDDTINPSIISITETDEDDDIDFERFSSTPVLEGRIVRINKNMTYFKACLDDTIIPFIIQKLKENAARLVDEPPAIVDRMPKMDVQPTRKYRPWEDELTSEDDEPSQSNVPLPEGDVQPIIVRHATGIESFDINNSGEDASLVLEKGSDEDKTPQDLNGLRNVQPDVRPNFFKAINIDKDESMPTSRGISFLSPRNGDILLGY